MADARPSQGAVRAMDAQRLSEFVAVKTGADAVQIGGVRRLSGGAIQENWAADLTIQRASMVETLPVVVRCDAPSGVAVSRTRAEEFALLTAAFEAGVAVPEPLWLGDASVFGRPFFVMRRVNGIAAGHRVVRDDRLGGDRAQLTRRLGEEIAKIQRVPASPRLAFLERPAVHPALHFIASSRAYLDGHHTPYPALEWGLRWLERNVPDRDAWSEQRLVLAHRDFRMGNLMIDERGLVGVLDWEFAAWSHPLEDLGWLCAPCWRFGQRGEERAAAGIGSREDLLAGYNRVAERQVLPSDLYYWEVLAEVRWALIAVAQAERHNSGRETSLELALTGHIVPQLELEILRMTGIDRATSRNGGVAHA